ncbi:MAG: CvpA family protein [Candidatus Aminicenantaceae bacterium]
MISNWLDVGLLLILAVFFMVGIIKGFVRQLIGLAAIAAGLAAALIYYPQAAVLFEPLVAREVFSHFLAFAAIFLIFLCLGWLISRMTGRAIKGPLKFFNHLLGGGLGIIKGVLLCGIICFSLLVFSVAPGTLKESSLAPLCLEITRYAVDIIPRELKEEFSRAYQEITGKREQNEREI